LIFGYNNNRLKKH